MHPQTRHRKQLEAKVKTIRYDLRQTPFEDANVQETLEDIADVLDGILEQLAWPDDTNP